MNESTGGSQCFYAQVGGRLDLKIKKKKLKIGYQGQVETLKGDLLVWLVATLNDLMSKSIRFNTKFTKPSQLSVAGQKINWVWKSIQTTQTDLKFTFQLK